MSNVNKHVALSPLYALLRDVKRELPTCNHVSLLQDMEILKRRVASRGLTVIMDDLPTLGKLYDKGLSSEYFDWKLVPHSLRDGDRCLFSAIIEWSFRKEGAFIDPDPTVVFLTRSILYLFKKVEMDATDKARQSAINDFVSTDNDCRWPSLPWNDEIPQNFESEFYSRKQLAFSELDETSRLLRILDYVTRWIVPQSRYIDWDDYRPKHGPGAVSDLSIGEDKYTFPNWPQKLSWVFPPNGWASHLHDSADDSLPDSWGVTQASKLMCVPKTLSKPRVIASEPTANQYCQQAVMQYLRTNMTEFGRCMVNFHDQEPSRVQALSASKHGDRATVDLSAASDRLTCWVVERFFRHNTDLLFALYSSRTTSVDCGPDHGTIHLSKFAAMGSAVTFPVQSLVYAGAALAAVLYERGFEPEECSYQRMADATIDIQVFGDDIIIPVRACRYLEELLAILGLKVNESKTHKHGYFRESCGMDAYKGYEVTPLYLHSLFLKGQGLAKIPSWVEVSNNAYRMGLWCLSEWMDNRVPLSLVKLIPVTRSNLGCVRLFTFNAANQLMPKGRRWNVEHQTLEYRVIGIQVTRTVERRNDWKDLLQYFIEGRKGARCISYLDPALTKVGRLSGYRTRVVVRWVSGSPE